MRYIIDYKWSRKHQTTKALNYERTLDMICITFISFFHKMFVVQALLQEKWHLKTKFIQKEKEREANWFLKYEHKKTEMKLPKTFLFEGQH